MSQIDQLWGAPPAAQTDPGGRYEEVASGFRPILAAITDAFGRREREHSLPLEQIAALKQSGFTATRLPVAEGGKGLSFPEFLNLIIELAEADSNIAQALRVHFGFVEDVLNQRDPARRALWAPRLAAGDLVGVGFTEIGEAKTDRFSTRLSQTADGLRLTGKKFYTTGTLYADWIDISASDDQGETVFAFVPRTAPGVTVLDDWDGFGQRLSASGTSIYETVEVAPDNLWQGAERLRYSTAYYQLYHLATLVGIGRALVRDTVAELGLRRRTFSHANAALPRHDAQVLAVLGKLRAQVYAAQAITLKAAEAVGRAFATRFAGDEAAEDAANIVAELESAQAQSVVIDLILAATTSLFDALSASATRSGLGLDRHWRNARTLASHNPRIYKDRIIGDWAVNGTTPPPQWIAAIHPDAKPAVA